MKYDNVVLCICVLVCEDSVWDLMDCVSNWEKEHDVKWTEILNAVECLYAAKADVYEKRREKVL